MKRIILNLLPVICSFALCFHVLHVAAIGFVNKEKASIVARNFFSERQSLPNNVPISDMAVTESRLIYRDNEPVYWVVNVGDGYIYIPAWDNVEPVLGYAFGQEWKEPAGETNYIAWMEQYADQIGIARQKGIEANDEITAKWNKYADPGYRPPAIPCLTNVEPMLLSKWDQGKFYNEMCPADPAGVAGHCVTGCVATAMGQLAYYFRFPETGTGSYSYYHPSYDTISANFGNTTYRWNEMTNSVNETNLALAELLFHMGVSVDMVYGPNSSGMYNHKAAYSLRTYFKYSPETQYLYRDSTTLDWDSVIIAHLDKKIPMYYAGWSVPNINGHAFIVDGYQGGDYFHFNWGWGGSYDGYFYLDQLNPGGSNFNLAQELIINCFPDTNNYTFPQYCGGDMTLTSPNGTFEDGSSQVYGYMNGSNCTFLIDPQTEIDSVTSVTLSFDRFDLVAEEDFVAIYDGPTIASPLLAMLTGNQLPGALTSSGNKMLVIFMSDAGNAAQGFNASYTSNRPTWCSGMTVLTDQTATFSDGSYSFYYKNNTICMWQLFPPGAAGITLYFTKFDTEPSMDVMKVIDPTNNTLLAEISGHWDPADPPPPVTSPSGKMFITFTTNGSVRADGWDAWYIASPVSIRKTKDNPGISIYPNPAKEVVFIANESLPEENYSIVLLNDLGNRILEQNAFIPKGSNTFLDVSQLVNGIYFLSIKNEYTSISRKVVVVQ